MFLVIIIEGKISDIKYCAEEGVKYNMVKLKEGIPLECCHTKIGCVPKKSLEKSSKRNYTAGFAR